VAFRSGENRLLVSAVFGAWLAFLLQSLFSIDQLGLTVWGWVIGGLVIGVSYAPKARPAANKVKGRAVKQQDAAGAMLPLTAATVLGMGAILWVSSPLSYDSGIRNAVSYSVDNTQTSQVTAVTQAVLAAVDGAQDPYWRTQAIGKLYAISAVDEGIKLAEESAQMFPNDMQIWNLVAIAYEQTGRAKLAVPARQRTVELDPLNTDNMELLAQDKAAK
jgi:hypothetical protein